MKNNVIPILIITLGIGAAVLFWFGMAVEAFACGVIALIVAVAGLK